jgi:hypothetical protein
MARWALLYVVLSSVTQGDAFLVLKQPLSPLSQCFHLRRGAPLAAWDGRGFAELKRRAGAACLSAALLASPLSLALHSGSSVSIERPAAQALTDEQVLVVSARNERVARSLYTLLEYSKVTCSRVRPHIAS